MNKVILPPGAEQAIKESAKKKIFIGIPNMFSVNVELVVKMFQWVNNPQYSIWFRFATELRHADVARNRLVQEFLKTECEYLLMIDDDVAPHPELLKMAEFNKDIIGGNVHCWIRGELLPSIWQRAECEACKNYAIYQQTKKIHDPSQYVEKDGKLFAWDPNRSVYREYAPQTCRCGGTGFDPYVYRTHQQLRGGGLLRCDSIGTAAIMIRRHVLEEMKENWFRFLYKPNGEILLTEDHYFCAKAIQQGFEVWSVPDLVCSHFKKVDLTHVNAAIINAYHKGMENQKHIDTALNSVMIPTGEGLENA